MKVVFDLILKTLKDADIASVYALGAHKGVIDGPTIIVKPNSASQYRNYSTTIQYFEVMCYGRTISESIKLLDDVTEAMDSLQFTVMPTFIRSTPWFDSNVQGWETSGTYRNFVKN